jgi:hypothetical protein
MNDLLHHRLKRHPPRSVTEIMTAGWRESLARWGEVPEEFLGASSIGLCAGLFGTKAWRGYSARQQLCWIIMAKRCYRMLLIRHKQTKPSGGLAVFRFADRQNTE